ncbi:MAG TPA: response regulator, partial [Candidatus Limnocylindrales bacterium]
MVEDDPAIAAAIRSILEDAGHAVDVAGDGQDALGWAGTYPYDLVILYVILPGMDGVAVCRALRERGSRMP